MKVIVGIGILLLVAVTLGWGVQQKNAAPVESGYITINHQGLRMLNGIPFSGVMITRYANGHVAALEAFEQGRRHGQTQKWFESGQLAFQAYYQEGVREGLTESWWFNGNRRSTAFFVNGKAEGEAWQWYRNGNKFKRFNYLAGQPSGLQQAWRKNGKLFSNFEYKNGRIFGLRKSNNCVGLEDEKISVDYYRNQAGDA